MDDKTSLYIEYLIAQILSEFFMILIFIVNKKYRFSFWFIW